jgi:hypothetical protein
MVDALKLKICPYIPKRIIKGRKEETWGTVNKWRRSHKVETWQKNDKKLLDTYRILLCHKLYSDDEESNYIYIHPWAEWDDGPAVFADMIVEASEQFTKYKDPAVPDKDEWMYDWEGISALVDGNKLAWKNKSESCPPDHRYWVYNIKDTKSGKLTKYCPEVLAAAEPAKKKRASSTAAARAEPAKLAKPAKKQRLG